MLSLCTAVYVRTYVTYTAYIHLNIIAAYAHVIFYAYNYKYVRLCVRNYNNVHTCAQVLNDM